MAYIRAQEVKQIRNALKARFPSFRFNCRKSSGGLGIEVTIKQGPIDFFKNYNDTVQQRPGALRGGSPAKDSMQVNEYWVHEHFSDKARHTLEEVIKIIKTASDRKWYDRSDARVDYFDTAFYIHLNVGSWQTPYHVVH